MEKNLRILKEERVEMLDGRIASVTMSKNPEGEYYVDVHPVDADGTVLYDICIESCHRTTEKSAELVMKFMTEIWEGSYMSEKYDHAVEVSGRSLSLINLGLKEGGRAVRKNQA